MSLRKNKVGVYRWTEQEPAVLNQHIFKVVPDYSKVDDKYFFYVLAEAIERMKMFLHGSTMQHVNRQEFLDTLIPLPPLAEQQRIADLLSRADRLRRLRRFALEVSDGYLQAVFLEMFGDPVTNPMGWERRKIREVCDSIVDCVNRTAPIVDYKTPYKMIRTSNVRGGNIDLNNVRHVTKDVYDRWTRRLVPRQGDVILTREAPLGEVGLLRTNDRVFLGQRLVQYRVNQEMLNSSFLLHAFQSKDLQRQMRKLGSGSTVEHIPVPDCKDFIVPIPPYELQARFARIADYQERLRTQQQEALRQAEHLFQTLLHRSFQGA